MCYALFFPLTVRAPGRSSGDNLASMRAQLTPSEKRSIATDTLVEAWRAKLPVIPGVRRFSISSRGGPPGKDLDVTLTGNSAAQPKAAAEEVGELLETVPSARGITDDLPYGKPELVMRLTPRGLRLVFPLMMLAAKSAKFLEEVLLIDLLRMVKR